MSINAKRVYYEIIGSCPNCEKVFVYFVVLFMINFIYFSQFLV